MDYRTRVLYFDTKVWFCFLLNLFSSVGPLVETKLVLYRKLDLAEVSFSFTIRFINRGFIAGPLEAVRGELVWGGLIIPREDKNINPSVPVLIASALDSLQW